jgi:autotransporter-associated beta strand protein
MLMGLQSAQGATIIKANNSNNLNLGSSWTTGTAPASGDVAQWDSTVTSAETVSMGADQGWLGINIVNPGGNITINTGNTLTLGSWGITSTPNLTVTLNNVVALSTAQSWSATAGTFVFAGGVNTAAFPLTLAGAGTKQFTKDITGGGAISITGGQLKLSSGAKATASSLTADLGATISYDTTTGIASAARGDSLTLYGAALNVGGIATTSSTDTNTHAWTIGQGQSVATITPNAATNAQLYSGSFIRQAGGVALFRGLNLGVNPIGSGTNSVNIAFASPPSLSGSGGNGTTTVGILPGGYGDTSATGNGAGLVTCDGTYGVRILNASTEYKASITDGQSTLDNIRLTGSAGPQATVTLNSATRINSLSFSIAGSATNAGITVTGTGVLKVNSGVIFGSQQIGSSGTADSMVVSVPTLDLNGREGIVLYNTLNTGSGGIGGGPLEIDSAIANDGGNGVTFGGSGLIKLSGSLASTYTGPTTLDGGNMWMARSGTTAIPGDLVINGGNVIDSGNQIPNSADIVINGGQLAQKASLNSGSGASETFRDLYITGGSYNDGAGGTSSGNTTLRNAAISGGAWSVTGGHRAVVSGSLAISNGGSVTVSAASGNSLTVFTLTNGLSITNTPTGAYVPMTIGSSSTNTVLGGQVILAGDVTVMGNSANANPVTINSPAPTGTGNLGTIALSGTRTFNIADGPAPNDLTITAALTDGTSPGGLIKTGAGTLVLAATDTYSGTTSVNGGVLVLSGTLAGAITVNSGVTEIQSSLFSIGALVVGNGGQIILDNTASFNGATIGSVTLAPGTYSYQALIAAFPGVFSGSASGSFISVRGATWYLSADQTAGQDWSSSYVGGWEINSNGTGTSPLSVNPYDSFNMNGHLLRTSVTDSTFGGEVLNLVGNSTLVLETGAGATSTIPDLSSSGGTILGTAGSYSQYLAVNTYTDVSGVTTFSAQPAGAISLSVGTLSGPGGIALAGGGTFLLNFTDATDYTGTITVTSGTLDFELPQSGNPLSTSGALVVNRGANVILNEWTYFTGLTISGSAVAAGIYPAASLGFSGTGGVAVYAADVTGPPQMFGVNLSGGDFNSGNLPGTYGVNYIYPNDGELAYYEAKGLNLIRLPFRWERVQHTLLATLDATEMGRLDSVIASAHSRGMKVILDMHNYNNYSISGTGYQVGSANVSYAAYQNVWSQLAAHYKNESAIYGYDIMNEPGGTLANWSTAAQGVVNTIRLQDTTHYIFQEGISSSGAQSWLKYNAALNIVDPVGRLIYSAHSYWDSNDSGTYSASYTSQGAYPTLGNDRVAPFLQWLGTMPHAHGHIGEFGVPNTNATNSAQWNVVLNNFLGTIQAAGLSATYWAGGPWWGSYILSCEPTNNFTTDAAQMSVLQNYTGAIFSSWEANYFSSAGLANATVSGASANPTGDGVCNLLDYAFGLSPAIFNGPSVLPEVQLQNGQLSLTYVRNKSASDLTFTVEVSGDMKTWSSGTTYTTAPTILGDNGFLQTIQVTDLTLATRNSRRFIRLKVTGP